MSLLEDLLLGVGFFFFNLPLSEFHRKVASKIKQ